MSPPDPTTPDQEPSDPTRPDPALVGLVPAVGDRRPTVPEPADRPASPVRRATIVLMAVLVALLAGLAAPDAWPAGDGTAELLVDHEVMATAPITLGDPAAVTTSAGGWTLFLPEGAATRGTVTAVVTRDGAAVAVGEVELVLVLPDGRREPVAGIRTDDDGALHLQRRAAGDIAIVLGVLGMVVVLWVSEVVPLWTTSLVVPFVLAATDVMGASDVLAPFFHPIIVLFFAGFLMAEAMRRVGLDRLAAVWLVAALGRSPGMLYASLLGVSAVLSMWMSNTAAVAVLLPIVLAIAEPLGSRAATRTMVLGVAYAATIGGVGSAIGTPANPIAMEFLSRAAGRDLTFVDWFAYGLPMVVLFLPLMGFILWRREGVQIDPERFVQARAVAVGHAHAAGRLSGRQVTVLVVFLLVVAAWLTEQVHGVSAGIIALGGAITLSALGLVQTDDLGRISWSSLLTFGGGLTLGIALTDSGASDWIATRLAGLDDLPSFVGILAVAVVTLLATTVASNTATAATFVPLAIPLAGVLGISPAVLVPVVAIASSVDFALVIGTPPTMLAYSTGLFTVRDILRAGVIFDLLGIVLLVTVVTWTWGLLGVV